MLGSAIGICPNLLDPAQNKNVPFKLWDSTNKIGFMYNGVMDMAGDKYRIYITTTTDRSQAVTVEYLPSLHLIDVSNPLHFWHSNRARFGLYYSNTLEDRNAAKTEILPTGEMFSPNKELTVGYASFDSTGAVFMNLDISLAFRLDSSA